MKWPLSISLVFLLVVGFSLFSVYKSDESPCSIQVISSSVAPQGDLVAVEFTRKCGPSSDITTNVSILPSSIAVSADDVGNVYIAKGDEPKIIMHWKGEEKLIIDTSVAKPYKQAHEFGGISVLYTNQGH